MTQLVEAQVELPNEETYLSLGRVGGHLYKSLRYAPPFTANQLFGRVLDETKDGHPELVGVHLADALIYPFQIEPYSKHLSGFREYICFINAKLDGGDLNRLLFSIASYKRAGLDTDDVLLDWAIIDNLRNQQLMERHAKELGLVWQISERDRKFFGAEIVKWYIWYNSGTGPHKETIHPGIIPVIRIGVDRFGSKRWIFDRLEEFPYSQLRIGMASELYPGNVAQQAPELFSPTAGFWEVVHFSPEITSLWPEQVPLNRDGTGPRRENSPSRSGGYALRQAYQFLDCLFIRRMEEYIVKNSVEVDLL